MEEVLNFIKENNNVTKSKIKKELGLSTNEVDKILSELQNNLKIEFTKNNTYQLTERKNRKIGSISVHPNGYGFVYIDDYTIFVPKKYMNGAVEGNKVLIEIKKDEQDRDYGIVLKRTTEKKRIVGTVVLENNELKVVFDNPKYNSLDIKLDLGMGLYEDYKVLVETNGIVSKIVEVLGHKNDPGIDILSIVKEEGIRDTFPESVMKEVDSVPLTLSLDDYKDRKDMRDEIIVTIDGDGAKDFDDAVCVKKLENGNYLLGVHIADVSHYVKEGSELDKEAILRGCSTYLTDRVIPMLPHKLSNGICSLNPNVDRLALSCDMEFDTKGRLINYDIYKSVINSKKRMKYHEVNEVIDGNMVHGYEEFEEQIQTMLELSHILREKRKKRGSVSFDRNEIYLEVDENGKPIDVKEDIRGEAERIIEDSMIAANETIASHASYMNLPFIYRIHGIPDEEKIEFAKTLLSSMGYNFKTRNETSSKDLNDFLKQVKKEESYDVITDILLKSMKKAVYSIYNDGHFALASSNYCHFTSPIRRYPDLQIHRLIKKLITNDLDYMNLQKLVNKLDEVAKQSSNNERKSENCERKVNQMKSAEYLEDKIGNVYDGKIITISSNGIGVRLSNQIEGYVPSNSLDATFDNKSLTFRSFNGNIIYRLGMPLKLKLVKADKVYRKIDFEIEKVKKLSI